MNDTRQLLRERIEKVDAATFDDLALEVFRYQYQHNPFYRTYLDYLNIDGHFILEVDQIPCLPIQFFKHHDIKTGDWIPEMTFQSSGTTGQVTSKHFLREVDLYKNLAVNCFNVVYGPVKEYCFLGLLPHYLERSGSSLVQMVRLFIQESQYAQSGFYLNELDELVDVLRANQSANIPTVLIGVSFALLDLADAYDLDLSNVIVMETGGMKGRREEWSKAKLHEYLSTKFKVDHIHSEYGMTELTSQFYAERSGRFHQAPSAKILIKEVADPFEISPLGKSGVINVIDLGNLDTCSFIETQDLGIGFDDGSFEIVGRLDHSDIRGCNLMVI